MARRTDGNDSTMIGSLLKGAVAGIAGVVALDIVTEMVTGAEGEEAVEREGHARPGAMDPAHTLANKVAESAGYEMEPPQPHPAGIATHLAFGVLPASVFGAFGRRRGFHPGRGMIMGLGTYLLQDQGLNYALGLAGPPTDYPWQAHARGLAGHLSYGLVTEGTLAIIEMLEPRRRQRRRYSRRSLEGSDERRRRETAGETEPEERPPSR